MKTESSVIVLAAANIALLAFALFHTTFSAAGAGPLPILRGRGLEIVDERGQTRATISVIPADPNFKMPDGTTGSPETVLIRLINGKGRPVVKIEATDAGAAVAAYGEDDPTHAALTAKGTKAALHLINKSGPEHVVQP